ncbi:hypothetical protein Barb7_02452 [Bacteroidales bacterium Barb7]|nr:hypothetical protein Barb7_02452 [Bacteroidales bacterium Barb7]
MSEHRIVFAKGFHPLTDHFDRQVHRFRHFLLSLFIVRHKLMQRRIKQTYCHRTATHCFEDALEVFFLIGEEFLQGFLAVFNRFGQNHFTHGFDLFALKEHVLRAAKTDTNGTELAGNGGIMRRVSIGAHLHLGVFVGQLHESIEITRHFRFLCRQLAFIDFAGRSVDRDKVAFLEMLAGNFQRPCLVIDVQRAGTGYTTLAHTASHNRRVRSHTPASRQYAFGGSHTGKVFGRSFDADKNHLMPFRVLLGGIFGKEHDLSRSSPRRGRQTFYQHLCLLQCNLVEHRMKEFVQFEWFNA